MRVRPIHFVFDLESALRFYEALGLEAEARCRHGNWIELRASGGELGLHDGPSAADGEIVTGVGGKQILLEDPAGNPVELFEPTLPEASLSQRA